MGKQRHQKSGWGKIKDRHNICTIHRKIMIPIVNTGNERKQYMNKKLFAFLFDRTGLDNVFYFIIWIPLLLILMVISACTTVTSRA
jgi:hypothetical protein